jgi:hypothetical protein
MWNYKIIGKTMYYIVMEGSHGVKYQTHERLQEGQKKGAGDPHL